MRPGRREHRVLARATSPSRCFQRGVSLPGAILNGLGKRFVSGEKFSV